MEVDDRVTTAIGLELWNAVDVVESDSVPPVLKTITEWLHRYIALPHPDLGRSGPICPFVPPALQLRSLWLSVAERVRTTDEICGVVARMMELYDSHEPRVGSDSHLRTFVVVLPAIGDDEASTLIDGAHETMKPAVVERGLMLGEFYPTSVSQGVHNPSFYSLKSPVPLLVIRHMVVGDLIFLTKPSDPPLRRIHFLRSYLKSMAKHLKAEHIGKVYHALKKADADICRQDRLMHSGRPQR